MKIVVALEGFRPDPGGVRFAARPGAGAAGVIIVAAPEGTVPHDLAGTAGLDRGLASA